MNRSGEFIEDFKADIKGTEEQIKGLCKKVNRLIVAVSGQYGVFLDYKLKEE